MASDSQLRVTFYSIWTLLGLIQSFFVELQGDEAYYWRYSQDLAWGYFDHPPVVAVVAKAGYLLFSNELGVRLFFVISIAATIFIIEKIVRPANARLFYLLVGSVAFLQIGMVFGGGMYALPDFPLLFFTALFIYLYRIYLEQQTPLVVIALGITAALLLMSKYHGILVIGFTALSNLQLLKKKSFWIIVAITLTFMLPHILWQIENDYPSLQFHFADRNVRQSYSWLFIPEYIISQPFVLGPLIGFILLYALIVFRPGDTFERGLQFLSIGVFSFFLVMSFRGRIEGNWTTVTLIPLLIIGYNEIEKRLVLKKVTIYVCVVSVVLIIVVRIVLIGNVIPKKMKIARAFGVKETILEMEKKFGDTAVAFMNSYQQAALYEFYTGSISTSLNNVWGRHNQYSFWDVENKLEGTPLIVVSNYKHKTKDSVQYGTEYWPYRSIEEFHSLSNIRVVPKIEEALVLSASDTVTLSISFRRINENVRQPSEQGGHRSFLYYYYFEQLKVGLRKQSIEVTDELLEMNQEFPIEIIAPPNPGTYHLIFAIQTVGLPAGLNSNPIKVVVK